MRRSRGVLEGSLEASGQEARPTMLPAPAQAGKAAATLLSAYFPAHETAETREAKSGANDRLRGVSGGSA